MLNKPRYVIGLSGGKDSTALALRLAEIEPQTNWEYIITPTGDELPEMVAHWEGLEKRLGKPLIRITNQERTLNDLIQIHNILPNFRMRWCTRQLKIEPTIAWCLRNAPVIMHVGLRADEEEREGIYGGQVQSRFPFREWGWSINEVQAYLKLHDISIPARTDCARCYHQKIREWHTLWSQHPEIYANAVQQEQTTGRTFRTPGRDTWPVALIDLAQDFKRGREIRPDKRQGKVCRVCSL